MIKIMFRVRSRRKVKFVLFVFIGSGSLKILWNFFRLDALCTIFLAGFDEIGMAEFKDLFVFVEGCVFRGKNLTFVLSSSFQTLPDFGFSCKFDKLVCNLVMVVAVVACGFLSVM